MTLESTCRKCGCVLTASCEEIMDIRKRVHEQDHTNVAVVKAEDGFLFKLTPYDLRFLREMRIACS